jgi:hypothetical protein
MSWDGRHSYVCVYALCVQRGHAGTAVTSAVSAAPTTDDTQLSARMWEAAAAAAQLPSEIES